MSYLNQFIEKCQATFTKDRSSEVKVAKDYLSSRGISDDSIEIHKIGYCLKSESIPDEIKFYGKPSGSFDSNGNGHSYSILGRIVVPIYSEFSTLVGFATRKPSLEPGNTWWNLSSPFKKGEHLFLLNKTRRNIFEKNKIYLVEGYIDAIILYQEGIKEVAALMGIHLTSRKIGLIARYCDNICLCLDVDENNSGQKGRDKAIHALRDFNFQKSISIIDLPVGEDPDIYVINEGISSLLEKEKVLSKSEIKEISKKILMQRRKNKGGYAGR